MAEEAGVLRVTVACSPAPRQVCERLLELPQGTTVRQAVDRSGLRDDLPDLWRQQPLALFVWGRAVTPDQPLRDGDRVEILRRLRVDPKVARRERFVRQGARAAGLFARADKRSDDDCGPPTEGGGRVG